MKGNVVVLLLACGFVEIEPKEYAWLDTDFTMLNRATLMVDNALDPIRIKFMTPEEADKHMALVKQK